MKDNSLISSLKNHTYKKGVIQPPMNTFPGTTLASWTNDRLPEYLWLGLVFMNYHRTDGIEKAGKILKEISQINDTLIQPKLSIILSLSDSEQEAIFKIICKNINPKLLAPLTVIYKNVNHPLFNHYFNFVDISVNDRINTISDALKLYYDHQSHESTDLRFIISSMRIFQGKFKVFEGSSLPEALQNYPYTEHDDERMKMYRPSIRTMEMIDFENTRNESFIKEFWKEIGLKTNCKPIVIGFKKKEEHMDYKKYILEFQKKLNHLINEQKELSILDDRFDVIVGTTTYALKIFNDVIQKNLDESILGRHAFRTVLEAYINIKYLLKIESEHPNIWQDYKVYGIGKYKFPLLKERENNQSENETHFSEPLIEILVNEIMWEEYIDIDLRYFDKKKVKEKFEEVDEKYMYEVLYEYDNNFIHAFWGAIRESSMLHCDNPSHKYHSVPDVNFEQRMVSINGDIYKLIDKFLKLIEETF